jgi:hypothetical protein
VVVGLGFLVTAVLVGTLSSVTETSADGGVAAVAGVLSFVGVVVAIWFVYGANDSRTILDGDADPDAGFGQPAPERPETDPDLSGRELAAVVEEAGTVAREERSLGAGLDVVRPSLRETLHTVLVQAGADPEAATRAIDTGAWTDDETVAAVLSDTATGERRTLLERLGTWLFPERVCRQRTRRAVGAIDALAQDVLPSIPGQDATKSVSIVRPAVPEIEPRVEETVHPAADADFDGSVADDDVVPGATAEHGPTDVDVFDWEADAP